MSTIHRHRGQYDWEGVSVDRYPPEKEMRGASVRWLIGPAEGAPNFALRYFEIEPGGWSSLDQHAHEHGVFILRGQGQVLLGKEESTVAFGDVVYVSPYEPHQFKNIGDEPLGFLCVIPSREEDG
jgi:quercetin dioxygenase-like cupin family protein